MVAWFARAYRVARRWSPALSAMLVAASVACASCYAPGAYERFRLAAFDTLQRLSPRQARPSRVQVVVVDEESLARLGQWPWSRNVLADLVAKLQDLGAVAIGFDIVFAEPDRTSPARLAAGTADYDQQFAAAVGRGRVVLGFGLRPEAGSRWPDVKAGFATIGADPTRTVMRFAGAVTNLPVLEAVAEGLGSFSVVPGPDQTVRRLPMLQALGDQLVPSLSLETLRVGLQVDTIVVRSRQPAGSSGPLIGYRMQLGGLDIPVDADGAIWLHHAVTDPRSAIAAWRLLNPAERDGLRSQIAGKMVLIGASATGLVDLRSTPLNPYEPGVNINADALDQVLSGEFLSRPFWAEPVEWLTCMLLAGSLGILMSVGSMRTAAFAATCGVAGVLAATWISFQAGFLLDPAASLATVVLTIWLPVWFAI